MPAVTLADKECYLFTVAGTQEQRQILESLANPLFNNFVNPLKEVPSDGLSSNMIKKSCIYQVTLTAAEADTALQITSQRADKTINSTLQLDGRSLNDLEHGLLKAIFKAFPDKQAELCKNYSEQLPGDCQADQTVTVFYESSANSAEDDVLEEARGLVWEAIELILQKMDHYKPAGTRKILKPPVNLSAELESRKTPAAVSFKITTQREKRYGSLIWAGMVDVQVTIKVYSHRNGKWAQVGSLTTSPKRRPIRKWADTPDALSTQYQSAVRKLLKKWSQKKVIKTISKLAQ